MEILPGVTLHVGDNLEVLAAMPDGSVDAMVTDPPAGIAFMTKDWDGDRGGRTAWVAWLAGIMTEAHRVLKPGGHALVWALPRTSHWTATALEDAGFEIRDCVVHLFGSGFPKSHDIGKAIDKARDDKADIHTVVDYLRGQLPNGLDWAAIDAACGCPNTRQKFFSRSTPGMAARCPTWDQWRALQDLLGFGPEMDAEVWRLNGRKGTPGEAWDQREVIGTGTAGLTAGTIANFRGSTTFDITAPATDDAKRWDGWGTALKPGQEHWWLVRKPFKGTVAANVLTHGVGAINVDGCRVDASDDLYRPGGHGLFHLNGFSTIEDLRAAAENGEKTPNGRDARLTLDRAEQFTPERSDTPAGRWPTNLVLTHSAACMEGGECAPDCPVRELDAQSGVSNSPPAIAHPTAARPRTAAKGAEAARLHVKGKGDHGGASRFFPTFRYQAKAPVKERPRLPDGTAWATVKPVNLMRFLTRMITPPGGVVLDLFGGTGTTAEACLAEGFQCVLIERDPVAVELTLIRLGKLAA